MRILSLQECQKISGNGKVSQIVGGSLGAIALGYVACGVAHPIVGWSVGTILLSVILAGNLILEGIPKSGQSHLKESIFQGI